MPSASCVRKGAPGSQTSGLTTRPSTSTSNHTSVPCVTSQPQTPPPFWLTPRMCTIWRPIGSSPSSLRSSNWRSMRESLVLFACRREKGEPCSQLMSRKWLTKCTQLTREHWFIQDFIHAWGHKTVTSVNQQYHKLVAIKDYTSGREERFKTWVKNLCIGQAFLQGLCQIFFTVLFCLDWCNTAVYHPLFITQQTFQQ